MQEIKTNPTVRHTTPLQLLAAFAATVAVLFVLLLGACALPAQPVLEHVYDSAQTIQQEGLYPEYFGFKLFQMDNYTDTIMLFEAAAMGEQDPLTAMMTATAYNVDNFETMAGDLAVYCERTIPLATGAQKAVHLVPFSYARYWHGYLIWLRPLLCVMSITGVRVVQYLVLFALLAVILWQLRRQCGLRAMVWFAVSQLAVTVFWVPHQVQYFTTFCIAYAGCAWVLARPRRAGQLSIALVVLGTCTAFCDLLVTPIITLGLPVAVWLCCLPQRAASGARQCLPVIGGSLCWGRLCHVLGPEMGAGHPDYRAGYHRRCHPPGRGAHHGGYLARHGAELGEHLPLCGGYIKPARAVVAGGAGGYFVHCGVFALPAQ